VIPICVTVEDHFAGNAERSNREPKGLCVATDREDSILELASARRPPIRKCGYAIDADDLRHKRHPVYVCLAGVQTQMVHQNYLFWLPQNEPHEDSDYFIESPPSRRTDYSYIYRCRRYGGAMPAPNRDIPTFLAKACSKMRVGCTFPRYFARIKRIRYHEQGSVCHNAASTMCDCGNRPVRENAQYNGFRAYCCVP